MDPAAKLRRYSASAAATTGATDAPARLPASPDAPSFLPDFAPLADDLFARQVNLALAESIPLLPFSALSLPVSLTGLLDLAGPGLSPGSVLFLDTETTGLSIGTGTIPFLIGLAWLEESPSPHWTMRQLFLNSPAAEGDLVAELDSLFERFAYLCTFNGKSYDVPLIRNRFTLQRRRMKAFAHHFDLLHIWKRLLPADLEGGFRQKNLETCILGLKRDGDLEGSAIPALYFDWIKYGVDNGIADIVRHNALDMSGMIGLYGAAAETMHTAGGNDTRRRIRVGRLLYRNGLYDRAIRLLEPIAVALCENGTADAPAANLESQDLRILLTSLGLAFFRTQDFPAAACWFGHLVKAAPRRDDLLFLLRILEYRTTDFAAALGWMDRFEHLLEPKGAARRRLRLERKRP